MQWYYYVIVGFFVLCGVLYLLNQLKSKTKLPYNLNKSIFNKSEAAFYSALREAVGSRAFIAPKIGMKDFLYVISGTPEYKAHFARMAQKHVDFLLFTPDTYRPLCAIEIDGPSHNSKKVQERDAFVKRVYESVDLPLFRFKAKTAYTVKEISEALTPVIESS